MRQEELAKIIGVQNSSISLYEMDKNSPSDAVEVNIAKFFNISLDYLFGIIDEPVPFHDEKHFLYLPDSITEKEALVLSNVLEYILHMKIKGN